MVKQKISPVANYYTTECSYLVSLSHLNIIHKNVHKNIFLIVES